jgi:hypothetical protein
LWIKALTPELLVAYQSPPTELMIQAGSNWTLPVELAKARGEFVVLTSDNPFSRPYSEAKNSARREKFLAEVQRRGISFALTRARNNEGQWPDEIGIALWGISETETQRLSRRWGQYAYYFVDQSRVSVVVTKRLGLFGGSQKN